MGLYVQCNQQCADGTDQQDRNPGVPLFLAFAVHNETQHGKAKPEPVHYGVLSWAQGANDNNAHVLRLGILCFSSTACSGGGFSTDVTNDE